MEALLATVLFAGGMVAVLQAYTYAANATGEVEELLRATILMEATADDACHIDAPAAYAGRCDMPYTAYHRRVEIRRNDALPRIAEVTIILGKDGSDARHTLITRVYETTP